MNLRAVVNEVTDFAVFTASEIWKEFIAVEEAEEFFTLELPLASEFTLHPDDDNF